MSGGKKRSKVVENQGSESSDSDPTQIDVDFEAFPFDESDYGGLTALLKQLLGQQDADLNFPGLADIIIKQSPIGTVLKPDTGDDDEEEMETELDADAVFGFTSVLDLAGEDKSTASLLRHFRGRVDKAKRKNSGKEMGTLKSALADMSSPLGLIFNERILNIPHQVSLPSLKSLVEDLERGGKKWSKMTRFLFLIKIHAQTGDSTLPPVFANAEEELLAEENESWVEWQLESGEQMSFEDASFTSKRRLCLLSKPQLLRYIQKLEKELAS